MNTNDLIAIDVHVHLETELDDNEANEAAKKYFGNSGVGRNRHELAEYYRSRKIGCASRSRRSPSRWASPWASRCN